MEALPKSIQELPPKQARLCLEIEKFGSLKAGLNFSSKSLVVGTSGGIDSSALLIISALLARKSKGRIICAHVDHGLRKESADELEFVKNLAERLGVTFHAITADVNSYAASNAFGIEEAGRIIRYNFFNQCLKEHKADLILTAHHLDDLSEDVVMRLIRGTGWPALSGMPAYDPQRKLLRPLLSTNKERLKTFLESINCSWCEDESNLSDNYTRNRVRNRLMPLIREENPSFDTGIIRLKNQAELDEDYWATEIRKAEHRTIQLKSNEILLPCSVLDKCHPALRIRIYKSILDKLSSGHTLADSLMRLDSAYTSRKGGTTIQFPGNKAVIVTKKGLKFKVIKTIDRESGKV